MQKSLGAKMCLPAPKPRSHKGQNGVVLIIGGSQTYHGAPVLSALAAMRFCDLVYFHSTQENHFVFKSMKIATPNVICVTGKKLDFALTHADCVLIGNGMEPDDATRKTLERILKTKKKCVIDAGAIKVLPKGLLHRQAIITPHSIEFKSAFGKEADGRSVAEASKKYGCTILFKGNADIIGSMGKLEIVKGGNPGMTKGGTGDVLAGLLAAIYSHKECSNPMKAAFTASYLNKRAGDMLFRVMNCNFS